MPKSAEHVKLLFILQFPDRRLSPRAPLQPEVRGEGPGTEREKVREGGEDREGEGEEGHPEGQHGRGQDPRGERNQTEESVAELSPDECQGGCGVQSRAVRVDHPSCDHLNGGCGEGDGRRDEGHEPGADLRTHGQVRAAVRGPGRAEFRHGEHNVTDGDDSDSTECRGLVVAGGGG